MDQQILACRYHAAWLSDCDNCSHRARCDQLQLQRFNHWIRLTRKELNDIWRAKLILDDPDDWTPAATRAASKRLGQLVTRIKASHEAKGSHEKVASCPTCGTAIGMKEDSAP